MKTKLNQKTPALLFADIGNTSIDLLFKTSEENFLKFNPKQPEILKEYLEKLSSDFNLEKFYISYVNKQNLKILTDAIKEVFVDSTVVIVDREMMKNYCSRHNLTVNNLDILGTDLFCDIISKNNKNGQIIIDLGTAGKILYLSKENVFYGCLIFPGIPSFPEILTAKTYLLEFQNIDSNPPLVSLDTKECISSGALNGTSALIASMIKAIKEEYHCPDADIFLCGGNGKWIKEILPRFTKENITYDELHIIHGLIRLCEDKPNQ